MVQLVVKGTRHPDEFIFECDVNDKSGDIAKTVAGIQNCRIKVKNQLLSWDDLLPAARVATAKRADSSTSVVDELALLMEEIRATLKNPKAAVPAGMFENYWNQLRDYAVHIFPNECVVKKEATTAQREEAASSVADDSHDAAIVRLYELHDNPDLNEDYRLHIYHCRTILDPLWRVNELLNIEKGVSLWFNGKALKASSPIGRLCGDNNKSKVTVKVAAKDGSAPSLEPTIDYKAQRELREVMVARRETLKGLEDTELQGLIVQQAKDKIRMGSIGLRENRVDVSLSKLPSKVDETEAKDSCLLRKDVKQ